MSAIFISYRREDATVHARALFERLRHEFGPNDVFIDQEGIDYGVDFVDVVNRQLRKSSVMLVLIDPQWATATDKKGRRRIDRENDYVRTEIATALARGIRTVPVLVDGAEMPDPETLPEVIRPLARLNAVNLDFSRFDAEVGSLVAAIRRILAEQPPQAATTSSPAVRGPPAPAAVGRESRPARGTDGPSSEEASTMSPEKKAPVPDEVYLGVSAPLTVSPGDQFVARFAAYTKACRGEVHRVFKQEAPSSHPRLDLEKCRWRRGARVTVRLVAQHVKVSNPIQTFTWNGTWHVLRFDATVLHEVEVKTLILGFQIAVEGLPLIALRPEIELLKRGSDPKATPRFSFAEEMAPNSAFASYARADRKEVLGRVRSLQIFTGIDVFLDCLSVRPGEEWKPILLGEIRERDIFWLFWSRNAMDSPWVGWEWRTALASKSLTGIQPHPLEPAELAPPPKELSDLQFGAMYEWYLSGLRESWLTRRCRTLWHRTMSVMR